MQYPLTPRNPRRTTLSEKYRFELGQFCENLYRIDRKGICYIYSYRLYPDSNTIDNNNAFNIDIVDNHGNYIIVIDSEIDTVDYVKFILSDVVLRMLLNVRFDCTRNTSTLMCVIIGKQCDKWHSFCNEYYNVRRRMLSFNTRNECNKLWDKYFMYNEYSRTREYLDVVMNIDKVLPAYKLPEFIDCIPSEYILAGKNIISSKYMFGGYKDQNNWYKPKVNDLNHHDIIVVDEDDERWSLGTK